MRSVTETRASGYQHDSKNKSTSVKKRPPPVKLHPLIVGDKVTISRQKGDDWKSGEKVEVKSVNPRQPNILHVKKNNGKSTFLPHFDVTYDPDMEAEIVSTDKDSKSEGKPAQVRRALPNKYLQWP